MRILKSGKKVYGFDELDKNGKIYAAKWIEKRRKEGYRGGKIPFLYGVNDFEFFDNGDVFYYTHNENVSGRS